MVALQTAAGKAVLCGDIAYTYKNIRDHIPVGCYTNLADTVLHSSVPLLWPRDLISPFLTMTRQSCKASTWPASFKKSGL